MSTYIRDIEAHCALGAGLETGVEELLAGRRHLGRIDCEHQNDPVTLPYFAQPGAPEPATFFATLSEQCDRSLARAGLTDAASRRRTAVLLGSSSFDVQVSEQHYHEDLARRGPEQALPMPIVGYGKLAQRLTRELGLSPLCQTYSTACTSSANAMLYGHRLIEAGLLDHALVVGLEYRNQTSLLGFHSLGLISPSHSLQPFGRDRDGLLLGEGLGLVLLSRQAPASGPRWQLLGGAVRTDNHSLTAAHSDGIELAQVIDEALRDSELAPQAIRAVKVHGTASLANDEAEAAALTRVFGGHRPLAFGLKPWVGHTLGACGALEAALTLGCLARGRHPGRPDYAPDPGLDVTLAPEAGRAPEGAYLFNCFAFGGNNNALVLDYRAGEASGA